MSRYKITIQDLEAEKDNTKEFFADTLDPTEHPRTKDDLASKIGIVRFLETDLDTHKLICALEVLRTFKKLESMDEFIAVPFMCWTKLEQLEEYLAYLVGKEDLRDDTKAHLDALELCVPDQRIKGIKK